MKTCSFVGGYRFFRGEKLPPSLGMTKEPASFSERPVITYGRTEPQHEYITNRAARFLILDEIKTNRRAGHVERMGNRRGAFRVFVGCLGEETAWKTQA